MSSRNLEQEFQTGHPNYQEITLDFLLLYGSKERHRFDAGIHICSKLKDAIMDFQVVNDTLCELCVRCYTYTISLILDMPHTKWVISREGRFF